MHVDAYALVCQDMTRLLHTLAILYAGECQGVTHLLSPSVRSSCNLGPQGYKYTGDLLRLENEHATASAKALPEAYSVITTPINIPEWKRCLTQYPDSRLVSYLLRGFTAGFRIGCSRGGRFVRRCKGNMSSALEHSEVVASYLQSEQKEGRLVGPISPQFNQIHISPFGVIPKHSQPNKWRLITDLSSPPGSSVNDGIDPALCSVHYAGLDEAIAMVRRLGRGCLLAKTDLKNAYRIIPVHPDDRPLLGVRWGEAVFLDAALPFGLRSAPKIFSAVADALLWILAQQGVEEAIHYLDDFLIAGRRDSSECEDRLAIALDTFESLGVPVAQEKTEGPSSSITYLGIVIDTVKGEIRLPQEKLARITQEIEKWSDRKASSKRELLSLLGLLHHAASVVVPGRPFLRHLITLSKTARHLHYMIRLNKPACSDILWWHTFMSTWNGLAFLPFQCPQVSLTSDASGSWGCGAFWDSRWLQLEWTTQMRTLNIAVMELLPILLAAAVWGPKWQSCQVTCYCDNESAVTVINRGSAKDPGLAQLLRCISFYSAYFRFNLCAQHVAGSLNQSADALSRNNLQQFFFLHPQAQPMPEHIPCEVIRLATTTDLEWTSPAWRALFRATLPKA